MKSSFSLFTILFNFTHCAFTDPSPLYPIANPPYTNASLACQGNDKPAGSGDTCMVAYCKGKKD